MFNLIFYNYYDFIIIITLQKIGKLVYCNGIMATKRWKGGGFESQDHDIYFNVVIFIFQLRYVIRKVEILG